MNFPVLATMTGSDYGVIKPLGSDICRKDNPGGTRKVGINYNWLNENSTPYLNSNVFATGVSGAATSVAVPIPPPTVDFCWNYGQSSVAAARIILSCSQFSTTLHTLCIWYIRSTTPYDFDVYATSSSNPYWDPPNLVIPSHNDEGVAYYWYGYCPYITLSYQSAIKCYDPTPCTQRTPEAIITSKKCSYGTVDSQDGVQCFEHQTGSSCVTACTGNYKGETVNYKCVLKDCNSRTMVAGTYPCETSNCYLQLPGGTTCDSNCPSPYAYGTGSDAGKCILQSCSSRQAPLGTPPCGTPPCYQQIASLSSSGTPTYMTGASSCATTCGTGYTFGTDGRCVLKDCASREIAGGTYPCTTSDCYNGIASVVSDGIGSLVYKSGAGSCVASCAPDYTFGTGADAGKCVLKDCASRVSTGGTYPCATSNCYEGHDGTSCNTNCNPPYAIGTGSDAYKCVLLSCSSRQAPLGTPPCGSNDCYNQIVDVSPAGTPTYKTGAGSCETSCGTDYTFGTDGKCVLKDCASREKAGGTYPCTTSDCYNDIDSVAPDGTGSLVYKSGAGSCVASCASEYTFGTGADAGKCVLKDCASRVSTTGTYPCTTSDCSNDIYSVASDGTGSLVYKSGVGSCVTSCASDYTFGTGANAGKCVLKDCASRESLTTADPFPCTTSDCFRKILSVSNDGLGSVVYSTGSGSCVSSSSCDSQHIGVDNTGKCILRDCPDRNSSSGTYPCATNDCYQQIGSVASDGSVTYESGTGSCDGSCDDRQYTPGTGADAYKCVLKDCTSRESLTTDPFPCATGDCFRKILSVSSDGLGSVVYSTGSGSCVSSLSCDSEHIGVDNLGKCILRDCPDRNSTSDTYPCATSDCYQQILSVSSDGLGTLEYKTGDGSCDSSCDTEHLGVDSSGKCVLRNCPDRTSTTDTYPCATSDCYHQPGGTSCDTTCHNQDHYEPSDTTGECVLKICTARTKVEISGSVLYACGSEDCFVDRSGTGCVESCEDSVLDAESQSCITKKAKSGSNNWWIVLIICLVVAAIVIIAVVLGILLYRRRKKSKGFVEPEEVELCDVTDGDADADALDVIDTKPEPVLEPELHIDFDTTFVPSDDIGQIEIVHSEPTLPTAIDELRRLNAQELERMEGEEADEPTDAAEPLNESDQDGATTVVIDDGGVKLFGDEVV